jgi:hypothetical protein
MEGEGSPEMDDYGQEGGAMVEGQMMGDEYDQVSGLDLNYAQKLHTHPLN